MRLLIIGSLEGYIGAASKIAMSRGAKVSHADSVDKALVALRSGQGADLVMIDVKLDVGGFIGSLRSERISVSVVACGIGNDTSAAVNAIKVGAKEYIPLPPDAELIAAVLEAVAEENDTIIYRDPAMADVLRMADQVAASEASILITGDSGTGKELLARYLHRKSRRANQKLVSVNCAAIPENLLESELFGHEKGAFTGAIASQPGKFEQADGGTLLLDEISEMPLALQAKLLRVLQEREVERVGGRRSIALDIRVLATTNRDLAAEVAAGRFREDLFYRLSVFPLAWPPLRERPADILPLAERLLAGHARKMRQVPARLSSAAQRCLLEHGWPGNVRELDNAIQRALILQQGGVIQPEDLCLLGSAGAVGAPLASNPAPLPSEASAADGEVGSALGDDLRRREYQLIIDTLRAERGRRKETADRLGISARTLRYKLAQMRDAGVDVEALLYAS